MAEIPSQRRFVAVDPENRSISIERGPVPSPAADELLIKVSMAGLNRADLLQRQGLYPPPEDASPIMGLEVAGEVLAVGKDVTGWQVGDSVCALTHGGGYADYTVAPAGQSLPVPEGLSMQQAAALPEALLTVWHNLYQRCELQPGENVLIHGGASGIGTLGIGICKALGAQVYTTAGSEQKCRALEAMGAVRAINYRTEDFEEVLADLELKNRINVILDIAGGDFIQKNINVAAPEGRIVNIAFIRGARAEVNFGPMLMKRLTLTGSTLRAQTFAQKTVMVEEIIDQVYPHILSGEIRPVIDRVFPLEEAEQAQDHMQSGSHMGKILLEM
jgi:putative PIG3 family NAD(P)H quinone oxidoreductase